MMELWERETQLRSSLRDLPRALTHSALGTGLVTYTMVLTIPSVLVFQAGQSAGLSDAQTGSWLAATFAAGGLMTLLLSLLYRQPIVAGVSAVGAAFLAQALRGFTPGQAAGAYLLQGALIVLIVPTGLYPRLVRAIPTEVVLGMLVGVLLRFATGLFAELAATPVLAVPIVAVWLVAWRWLGRWVPPVVVALLAGVALSLALRAEGGPAWVWALTVPVWQPPAASLDAALALAVPLVLIALTTQNVSAIGVLRAEGYRPPISAITLATGLFSAAAAPFLGQGVSLGVQRGAVVADPAAHADPGLRYGAALVDGVLLLSSAAFATTIVALFQRVDPAVMRVVAGLALLPVLLRCLERAFAPREQRFGSLLALAIAASGFRVLGIGAVFWALVLPPLVSRVLERPVDARD
jgi:benzoate membrane transport protein